ncbi:MAG: acetate--CoA ligase family protein [Candidatus Helarchaeota archaeon]
MSTPFQDIFSAKSIAVIGASENPNKLGYRVVQNLLKQHKKVYPVNPKLSHILNLAVYPSITEVPLPIDLVIIIVPPRLVLDIIDACGRHGVKYVVIIAEGFRETGPAGARLQTALKEKLVKYNIRALGPNTMGFHDIHQAFSTCFLDVSDLKPGSVAISSQTGVLAGAFLKYLNLTKNIGVSKVIDLGNMIDLNHSDVLEFFANDPNTNLIGMHIEGLADGQRFAQTLSKVAANKPVIIVKGGADPETQRVIASHTGSLAGDIKLFESLIRKAGAIKVENFAEFVDVLKGFAFMKPPTGNKIAVITGSGGTAVITIDALLKNGLRLAPLSKSTQDKLRQYIPEQGKILNPIDIWPAGIKYGLDTLYSRVISILNEDSQVDAILGLLFRIRDFPYEIRPIITAAKACTKPIFFAVLGHNIDSMRSAFEQNGLPTYRFGEHIAKVLRYMWDFQRNRINR